ncbi:MAG: hypothetical protein DRP16_01595 [Candidatus Aenigmatarchaeota archaeon]|nr:MAG: hypothetical protein DRP16_01595 [Candidatus Aenigmarchaeota archaeon]
MTSSSPDKELKEDIIWIKNKLNEFFLARETRIKSYKKDINLIILSVLIAVASTLFIEIMKMIIGIYIPNKISSFSLTFIIFVVIIYILILIIPKQINKIAEIYDINQYRFLGEFAGMDMTEKLNKVKQFCKDLKEILSEDIIKIKFNPILTTTSKKDIKTLTEEQKENLLFEKINSLHLLDILLYDQNGSNISKIRIEVIRIEEKVSFFCLCNCDQIGENIKNKLKTYLDKSSVLRSLEYNF